MLRKKYSFFLYIWKPLRRKQNDSSLVVRYDSVKVENVEPKKISIREIKQSLIKDLVPMEGQVADKNNEKNLRLI